MCSRIHLGLLSARTKTATVLCLVMGIQLTAGSTQGAEPIMQAVKDPATGQFELTDGDQPVLRYNYRTVQPPDGYLEKVHPNGRKYAVARSDYIHPLYGPDGEVLTKDWSIDHPHHRGIYWAWPEVDYGGQRGDLHALQRVFARPTGNIKLTNGPAFAQIEAENLWKWEDQTPIVRERVAIRAYRRDDEGRFIDLTFEFAALEKDVAIARRGTNKYGGLNIRLAPVTDHQIITHVDPEDAKPRRTWADSVGIRPGGKGPVSFAVFQRITNPQYPGDWIVYPQLPWFQPTFPAAGKRYLLTKDRPLVLRYRLWIRRGGKTRLDTYAKQWQAFHNSPLKN